MSVAARAALVLLWLGASMADAQGAGTEVWLVGPAGRPSVVRYLRSQLPVEVHTARRVEDARGPLVVTLERGGATIAERQGDELAVVRTVSLRRGLDTTGRARLLHALRTVLAGVAPGG